MDIIIDLIKKLIAALVEIFIYIVISMIVVIFINKKFGNEPNEPFEILASINMGYLVYELKKARKYYIKQLKNEDKAL